MRNPEGKEYGHTGFYLFMILSVICLFLLVYLPSRENANKTELELKEARKRVTRLHLRINRVKEKVEALRSGEEETTKEAIRDGLRKGNQGSLMLIKPDNNG